MNVKANLQKLCVVVAATLTTTWVQADPPPSSSSFGPPPPRASRFVPPGAQPAAKTDWLLQSRMAIAAGNIDAADDALSRARQRGAVTGAGGDSADRIASLLDQARRFIKGPQPNDSPEQYRAAFGQFLVEQATGLIPYGQLDKAEELAKQAAALRASYSPTQRTPQTVLQQVAAARRIASGGENRLAATSSLSDRQPGMPRRLPQVPPIGGRTNTANGGTKKAEALQLLSMARAALDRGDVVGAEQLMNKVKALGVPTSAFGPNEARPWEVELEIASAQKKRFPNTQARYEASPAVANSPAGGGSFPVQPGVYQPESDKSRMQAAQATSPTPTLATGTPRQPTQGERLFQDGMQAFESGNRDEALDLFKQAWKHERQLDPVMRQQLQDKLVLLQSSPQPSLSGLSNRNSGGPPSTLEAVNARQQVLRQKLYREIMAEQANARQQSARDPRGALRRLHQLRSRVAGAEVDAAAKKSLLTVVDREVDALQQYMERNRAEIELAERNSEVMRNVALDAERRQQVQQELARLVDEFNELIDERRFSEAQVVARKARELDPEASVVQNLMWQATFIRRIAEQMDLREAKEQGFYDQLTSVIGSSTPFDDRVPLQYEGTDWGRISDMRLRRLSRTDEEMSPAEMEIYRKLKTKVSVDFQKRPLSEVLDTLSRMTGVPIAIDPIGLSAEGVDSETPVTLRLTQEVALRSALNLILEPLRLGFVIENEVLRVTGEQTRSANTVVRTYDVADLVIAIPNFVPSYNTGLAGAIQAAHRSLGIGQPVYNAPVVLGANTAQPDATLPGSASVLAQMGASGALQSLSGEPNGQPSFAPAGMGGAVIADFDTLMDLIRETIDPDSWEDTGDGNGTMRPFPLSLSLVISNTEETHEKISKLLAQLRRLQDVQITIEVRFITLNDRFFERIGVDFDFNIASNVDPQIVNRHLGGGDGPSVVVGLDQNGVTPNLDLEFRQFGFAETIPTFGGLNPAQINSFGFAILSDIEAFLLVEAAEGDSRSNVLEAPKVTMFNGQIATINDTSARPFVTSIEPVVADFAVAHRPVIVVLPEGTSLTVQAVVSSDRRYVRLTLQPIFSRIGDVEVFEFESDSTGDTGSLVVDAAGNEIGRNNVATTTRATRVQLPTFVSTSVSTTVNVPDGGTVLLGGIKRLSEGRDERGVPMLDKLPYINRLFKNVGIGRDTQSLMLMVTPRILIQEEEELKQTGYEYQP